MKGIYERGPNSFQVKWKPPGKDTKRITASFSKRPEAEAFLLRAQAAVRLGKPVPDAADAGSGASGGMTIQALFEKVDKKRWSGNPNSKSGEKGQRMNAQVFVRWCGPKLPASEALSEATIEDFVKHREAECGNSGGTVNRYMAAVSALCKEAIRLELLKRRPDLPRRAEGEARDQYFTKEQEQLIQAVTRQWGYEDHADLFVFLTDMGCRPKEAWKLPWHDVMAGGAIHFSGKVTKNAKPRTNKATPRVLAAVERMRAKYGHTAGPFSWADPNLRTTRTLWTRLRGHFPWLTDDHVVYTYRHTCASWLVQKGHRLELVMKWLGHSDIKMTMRYAKFAPKQLDELADTLALM
jgi:integrase